MKLFTELWVWIPERQFRKWDAERFNRGIWREGIFRPLPVNLPVPLSPATAPLYPRKRGSRTEGIGGRGVRGGANFCVPARPARERPPVCGIESLKMASGKNHPLSGQTILVEV
jgi:hypothetical protein